MAEAPTIGTGQLFRDIQLRLWGHQARIWVVESIFVAADGLHHARLSCADEPSLHKTLSLSALRDRRYFAPAEA